MPETKVKPLTRSQIDKRIDEMGNTFIKALAEKGVEKGIQSLKIKWKIVEDINDLKTMHNCVLESGRPPKWIRFSIAYVNGVPFINNKAIESKKPTLIKHRGIQYAADNYYRYEGHLGAPHNMGIASIVREVLNYTFKKHARLSPALTGVKRGLDYDIKKYKEKEALAKTKSEISNELNKWFGQQKFRLLAKGVIIPSDKSKLFILPNYRNPQLTHDVKNRRLAKGFAGIYTPLNAVGGRLAYKENGGYKITEVKYEYNIRTKAFEVKKEPEFNSGDYALINASTTKAQINKILRKGCTSIHRAGWIKELDRIQNKIAEFDNAPEVSKEIMKNRMFIKPVIKKGNK